MTDNEIVQKMLQFILHQQEALSVIDKALRAILSRLESSDKRLSVIEEKLGIRGGP